MKSFALLLATTCALFATSPLTAVAADTYPSRPVHLVVPFAPGGGTDLVARVLGEGMAGELGQPVVVDNKAGGGTLIGSDFVAKATPDGYTLLVATFANAVNPSLHAKMPYNQDTAFAPVSLIGRSPNVLVVRPDKPFKTVSDVIAYAKANPGKLSYGSFGIGTSAHLAAELFKSLAKVDLTHVPYRGAGPAITDLLAGQIDVMFTTISSAASHINGGTLRAIAVTSAQRSPAFPQVPTIAESGVPGYLAESWYGIFAPAGTPAEVIAKLNAAAKHAAASENFQKRIAEEGLVVIGSSPEELARYVVGEEARWSKIVRDAHIVAE
jgi:tripartite-type tricarboxylate transporter receptor subunit TctC